ncbi:DUF6010 family protein [Streptomyces pimonensis]|uniref:DUF6010 family protein n=1 Tax=Streptomyces pimonensis TaxID=2860288 RepID=UPI0035279E9C
MRAPPASAAGRTAGVRLHGAGRLCRVPGSWTFGGGGRLPHTAWDVVHRPGGRAHRPVRSRPAPGPPLGCAVCDPVIALWCPRGGPAPIGMFRDHDGDGDRRRSLGEPRATMAR